MSRGAHPLGPVDDRACRREPDRPSPLGDVRKTPPWRAFLLAWLTFAWAASSAVQGTDQWTLGPSPGQQPPHRLLGPGAWTPWAGWSACSNSCGDGVSFRRRRCIRFPEEDPCQGNTRQYRLCVLDGCPGDSIPFRDVQCSLYDGKPLSGAEGGFRWVPFHGAPNLCDLNCLAEGHNFYYTFGRVLDGTPCSPESRELCVSGQCLRAGCDGILGSEAQADACGVCAGRNDSCVLVKEVFFEAAAPTTGFLGYRNVTRIPAGTRHLQVTDSSRNYLALADANQRYLLNGDWTVVQPGLYEAGGTRVRYFRTAGGQERLEAEGPTLEDLWLTVLFQEPTANVEYQFWLPKERLQSDASAVWQPQIREAEEEAPAAAAGEPRTLPGAPEMAPHFQNTRKSHRQTLPRTPVRPGRCGKCEPPRGRAQRLLHYCNSDFVFRARVVSKRRVGQETRYDLQVKEAYRNRFPLVPREYVWAPDTCDCPPLAERREYVVMAQRHVNSEHTLNRILLWPGSYVRPWSPREDLQLRDAAGRCGPDAGR